MARIASGGGPTQRMPASTTAAAKSAFSLRNPIARVERVGAGRLGRVDDGAGVEQVERPAAVLPRDDDTRCRAGRTSGGSVPAISPRLATNSVRIAMHAA